MLKNGNSFYPNINIIYNRYIGCEIDGEATSWATSNN